MSDDAILLGAFIVPVVVFWVMMMIPIIIAFWRSHPNRWIIFIVTVVFGVTILGWLIALVWSLHGFHCDKTTVSHGGASGVNLFADDVKSMKIFRARADNAHTQDPEWQDPGALVRCSDRSTAAGPLLTIAEASALIERLQLLEARGDISMPEAVTTKRDILALVQ